MGQIIVVTLAKDILNWLTHINISFSILKKKKEPPDKTKKNLPIHKTCHLFPTDELGFIPIFYKPILAFTKITVIINNIIYII